MIEQSNRQLLITDEEWRRLHRYQQGQFWALTVAGGLLGLLIIPVSKGSWPVVFIMGLAAAIAVAIDWRMIRLRDGLLDSIKARPPLKEDDGQEEASE